MPDIRPEKPGQVKEYDTVIYGDNELGIVVDEKPWYINKKGLKIKPFLIHPLPHLVKSYPEINAPEVKRVPTPRGMAIWKEYPLSMVHYNSQSRTNPIVRIDCGFDGRPTYETDKHKVLYEENQKLQEEVNRLIIENEALYEQIELLSKSTLEREQALQEMINLRKESGRREEDEYEFHEHR